MQKLILRMAESISLKDVNAFRAENGGDETEELWGSKIDAFLANEMAEALLDQVGEGLDAAIRERINALMEVSTDTVRQITSDSRHKSRGREEEEGLR